MTRRGPLIVGATLLASANCEQVEVTTVSAARVALQPQSTSVAVSDTTRLTAVVLSSDGKTLTGRTIDWASLQPNIASVDSTGMVRGRSTGEATIRAVSGNADGTAVITVTAPSISLSPSDIPFSSILGSADPPQQQVGVTNAGGGSLTGLALTVNYQAGQPTGWLTATLTGATAPAQLNLRAAKGVWAAGNYTATVRVTSAVAQNSPQTVTVTFAIAAVPNVLSSRLGR